MQFKVEIEDFWLEEDEDIEASLKTFVIHDVSRKIQSSIEGKVDEQITQKIKELIDSKLESIIDNKLTELLATETILVNRDEVLISDYVKDQFQDNRGWRSLTDHLSEMGKSFSKEMKSQYDAAFANRIVVGMKEQGLLKDEVVQLLLDPK